MPYSGLFGELANIASVIAFLFAGYQFFQWRKQQRHSLEIECILNMEDRLEALINANLKIIAGFHQGQLNTKDLQKNTERERNYIEHWMDNEFRDRIYIALHMEMECGEKYSLACFRAERLGFNFSNIDVLQIKWIRNEFNVFINDNTPLEEVASKTSKIKTEAREHFKSLRNR